MTQAADGGEASDGGEILSVVHRVDDDAARSHDTHQGVEIRPRLRELETADPFRLCSIQRIERYPKTGKSPMRKLSIDEAAIGDRVGNVAAQSGQLDEFPKAGMHRGLALALQGHGMTPRRHAVEDGFEHVLFHVPLAHLPPGAIEATMVALGGDFDLVKHALAPVKLSSDCLNPRLREPACRLRIANDYGCHEQQCRNSLLTVN